MPSNKNKLIIRQETLPYINLFDLNKVWLDRKQQRQAIWDSIRQQRKDMYLISMEIHDLEEKISKVVKKLEKK